VLLIKILSDNKEIREANLSTEAKERELEMTMAITKLNSENLRRTGHNHF
jgi:hypothetical protein